MPRSKKSRSAKENARKPAPVKSDLSPTKASRRTKPSAAAAAAAATTNAKPHWTQRTTSLSANLSLYAHELRAAWTKDARIPTAESRRDWALARNVNPSKVHKWFGKRRDMLLKEGGVLKEGAYELEVGVPSPGKAEVKKEESPDVGASASTVVPSSDFDVPASSTVFNSSPPPPPKEKGKARELADAREDFPVRDVIIPVSPALRICDLQRKSSIQDTDYDPETTLQDLQCRGPCLFCDKPDFSSFTVEDLFPTFTPPPSTPAQSSNGPVYEPLPTTAQDRELFALSAIPYLFRSPDLQTAPPNYIDMSCITYFLDGKEYDATGFAIPEDACL